MRPAFTLVEQLAATALASLLMAASLAVLARISHGRARSVADAANVGDSVERILAWDLANASHMRIEPDAITLAGFDSLDAATLEPTHRPVRVSYRIESTGGRLSLVRKQTDLDVLSNRNTWARLVACGISRLDVTSLKGGRVPAAPIADAPFGSADGPPVPRGVELTLGFESGEQIRRVIWLR